MKVEGGSPKVEGPALFTVDAMEWVAVQGPTPGAPRNRRELSIISSSSLELRTSTLDGQRHFGTSRLVCNDKA
jgi:hypothetical protein